MSVTNKIEEVTGELRELGPPTSFPMSMVVAVITITMTAVKVDAKQRMQPPFRTSLMPAGEKKTQPTTTFRGIPILPKSPLSSTSAKYLTDIMGLRKRIAKLIRFSSGGNHGGKDGNGGGKKNDKGNNATTAIDGEAGAQDRRCDPQIAVRGKNDVCLDDAGSARDDGGNDKQSKRRKRIGTTVAGK